jgi:Ca2+-binding RTX toxin-like protein
MIDGGAGDDVLFGDAEVDSTVAFHGSDTIRGGSGDDFINPGLGNDAIHGGPGLDTVIYETDDFGVSGLSVDLQAGIVRDFFGVIDTLDGVDNVIGFVEGDALFGDNRANLLRGREGDDIINGRGGADRLVGDLGNDTLDGGVDGASDLFIYNYNPNPDPPFSFMAADSSDVVRNLDAGEDVLHLVGGLTDPGAVDPLISVQDDGADTTLRFVDGSGTITLIGVTEAGLFNSVSELVEEGIVSLM